MPSRVHKGPCRLCGKPVKRRDVKHCSRSCSDHNRSGGAASRFWGKVDKRGPDECWPWKGKRDGLGYGVFLVAGRYLVASRFALTDHLGRDLGEQLALHHCDSPPCCNPAHLYAGTSADNQRDAVRAGKHRDRVGDRNPAAKLTADDVREIRAGLSRGLTQSALAERFGVEQTNISMIKRGATWRHV